MKKIIFLLLIFFSILLISCKNPEFNLKVNAEFSSETISKFIAEYEKSDKDSKYLEYTFFDVPYQEAKEIALGMGDTKCFFTVNLATELSGLSLKKIYAKSSAVSEGYVSFENEIPDKAINAYYDYKKKKSTPVELNFSNDKKRVDFSYSFLEDSFFFDSEKNGDVDIKKVNEDEKGKKKFKIKIRGGSIVITPAEKIDGVDIEVVISRIKDKD